MMPDGSIDTQRFLFASMDKRLIEYGLCFIRGGPGRVEQIVQMVDKTTGKLHEILLRRGCVDEERQEKPRQWTRPEIEAAGRIHRNICRLPLQYSIVLQVFYGEWVAEIWQSIDWNAQQALLRDMTYWHGRPKGVNARIAAANVARRTNTPGIWPGAFIAIRDDGIRMLINAERGLKK